jgi:hypothetical protein
MQKRRKINMNVFSGILGSDKQKKKPLQKTERDELIDSAKPLALTPEMILNKPLTEKITFENISGVILRVRTNELIGKGKLTKDEYLADSLYSLVRHYEPDTRLTYELVEKAIAFVKRNPIMGAGRWTKEEHLAEYLYATIRLSNSAANNSGNGGSESSSSEVSAAAA